MREASTPYWRTAERRLKWTPYVAGLGGVAAVVLGVWVPLYPIVLALAAAAGATSVAIFWYGVRRRRKSLVLDPSKHWSKHWRGKHWRGKHWRGKHWRQVSTFDIFRNAVALSARPCTPAVEPGPQVGC